MKEIKGIKILHEISENEPYLVISKPAGMPSAPLFADGKNNAFSICASIYPELLTVSGKKEIEHGLLHRIDTETYGLLLIAATQSFYDYFMDLQKNNKVTKTYAAICDYNPDNAKILENFPDLKTAFGNEMQVESYFRHFGAGHKEVRPVTADSSKKIMSKVGKAVLYKTKISIIKNEDECYVQCKITNGFRHQVRCHLAWVGLPVKGDSIYNSKYFDKSDEKLCFCAKQIDFCLENGKSVSYIYEE